MKFSKWRQLGQRVAGMDQDELRDRLCQEFAKRQDAFLSHLRFNFAPVRPDMSLEKAPNFFFGPQSVDSILEILRQRLPAQVEGIVRDAEKICRHRFDLLGYRDLDYGSPIDWHLDPVHGKRAPRKAFYRIPYLDYAQVGDSKITWELNRHQHLVILAKAYRLTANPHFADELLRQWRHWQAENPYPIGINWASSLEAAFRSLSWLWIYHLLRGAPAVPDFRNEWLRGLGLHGRHIERYLSTYFSPNTHLLGEGVALFFLGVLCPELKAADRWKRRGWEIVLREAERQVRADGFHFEQSTYYHVYALDFFLHTAVLASVNGIAIPTSLEGVLEKMLRVLCWLGRGGPPPRYGDDDGGRLFDPRRNRAEHLLDPLATGAILFQRGDFKAQAGGLREETLWLLGTEGVKQWDNLEEKAVTGESAALPDAGYYMLASDQSTQLVLDAGPLGAQSGGHGHADALQLCLQSRGYPLLIDPGTFEYVGPGKDRDLFRGTAMHNTLRVDRANQADTATPFSWRKLTQSSIEWRSQGKHFDLIVASHDGYRRAGNPITHRRYVVSLRNGIYFVRDVVEGQGQHRLDIGWHLGEQLQPIGEGLYRVRNTAHGLALVAGEGHGWTVEVSRESWSPVYGQKAPMTVLNFSKQTTLPAEFAIMLVTLEEAHPEKRILSRLETGVHEAVRAYKYCAEGVEYLLVFSEKGKEWRTNGLSADASFVCWIRNLASGEERFILCEGTFAQAEGGPELRCARPVKWAEMVVKGESHTVFSSDPAALEKNWFDSKQPDAASPIVE